MTVAGFLPIAQGYLRGQWHGSDGDVIVRCPGGCISSMMLVRRREIAKGGTVERRLTCGDCEFDGYVRLEGWEADA